MDYAPQPFLQQHPAPHHEYDESEYDDRDVDVDDDDDVMSELPADEEEEESPLLSLQLLQQQKTMEEDEEAANQQQEEEPDPSMLITQEEKAFALQIKQEVEKGEFANQFTPLTDYEYAQWSIVTQGNLQEALKRIHGMQVFQQEYGINHSVEQAVTAYREHFRQFPGYVLHIDVDTAEETHEPIVVLDLGNFFPNRTLATPPKGSGKHPDYNWQVDAIRNYYQIYSITPSLSAIRQGIFCIIDCKDIGWDNFTMEYSQRFESELWGHQPLLFKNLLCYNTGSVANVCWNMIKHLMDNNMKEKLQLGCQLEDQLMDPRQSPMSLSDLYLQPSVEAAQQKMLQRIAELVELRNHNQATFRL